MRASACVGVCYEVLRIGRECIFANARGFD
jgi:hypothetical protein